MTAGQLAIVALAYLVGLLIMVWKLYALEGGPAPWTWTILLAPPVVAAIAWSRVGWRCGACGRYNRTGLIAYILQWCDHGPDFS